MRRSFLITLTTFSVLISCQTTSSLRLPASSHVMEDMTEYYDKRARIGQISDQMTTLQLNRRKMTTSAYLDDERLRAFSDEKQALEKQAGRLQDQIISEMNVDVPTSIQVPFQRPWRQQNDELIIHELQPYALKSGEIVRKMFLTTDTTTTSRLQLTNLVVSWKIPKSIWKKKNLWKATDYTPLYAELNCNEDALIHLNTKTIKAPAGQPTEFLWYDKELTADQPNIELKNPKTSCDLKFSKNKKGFDYGIKLLPETIELARIGSPHLQSEICIIPTLHHDDQMDQFFLSTKIPYLTCPTKVEEYETLENPLEGINAKIRALTGKNLSNEFLLKKDPFEKLDFTQAPKLDAILISYLVFRADYSGQVIMQALRHHAQRGALIRIAVSDVISLGKDRQMLLDFQAEYPNVKLIFYKYRPQGKGMNYFKDFVASFHRTNHIKLFLTYSKSDEKANKVILGGRNIHDGFVFEVPFTNYIFPNVVSYSTTGEGDESWARWEDFETLFTSPQLVKAIMGQFFSVLHADYSSFHIRSYVETVQTKSLLEPNYFNLRDNEVYLRSFVSIPFKDGQLLEKTFIQMLDSAKSTIKVSTPYFNLTPGLLQAFVRAAERNVKIELITRLDLKGDTADFILSDVNKAAVNKLYDKIRIFEYMTEGKILHSKLFLIDNKFVMMGSVNMNLRSFVHDIENATLVYGPGFNAKIEKIYENYKTESKPITNVQKTNFFKGVLINLIGTAL